MLKVIISSTKRVPIFVWKNKYISIFILLFQKINIETYINIHKTHGRRRIIYKSSRAKKQQTQSNEHESHVRQVAVAYIKYITV